MFKNLLPRPANKHWGQTAQCQHRLPAGSDALERQPCFALQWGRLKIPMGTNRQGLLRGAKCWEESPR